MQLQQQIPTLGLGSTFDPAYIDPLYACAVVEDHHDLDSTTIGGNRWWVVRERPPRRLALGIFGARK